MTEEQQDQIPKTPELPGIHSTHENIAKIIATDQTPESSASKVLEEGLVNLYGEAKAQSIMAKAKEAPKVDEEKAA